MSINAAGFPTWDGVAGTNRTSREQNQGAWDYEDWDQLVAEILAQQAVLAGAGDITFNDVTVDGDLIAVGVTVGGDIEIDGALNHDGTTVGFYGSVPTTKLDVTGAHGANAGLISLLGHLVTLGLVTDSTT